MTSWKQKMPETMYRASRYCRVLGNPTAYMILKCLGTTRKTPSKLSEELGVRLPTVSMTLKNLRQVNLVRYETEGTNKIYWIKDKTVLKMLAVAENLAEAMRKKRA